MDFFSTMCELEDQNAAVMTVGLNEMLAILDEHKQAQEWTKVRWLNDFCVAYAEAYDMVVEEAKEEILSIRFFTAPRPADGVFVLCAAAKTVSGRTFILSDNFDFMEAFARHDYPLFMM